MNFESIVGFTFALLGLLVTIISLHRKIQNDNAKSLASQRDSLAEERKERAANIVAMQSRIETVREACRENTISLDKRILLLEERLANMPTRSDIEDIVDSRMRALQMDLRALTLQLTHLGMFDPSRQILKNGEQYD